MRPRKKYFFPFCFSMCLLLPLVVTAREEWRIDPIAVKLKWQEEQFSTTLGGGYGYYSTDLSWNSDFKWRNPFSTTQPRYFKMGARRRLFNDWWANADGQYSLAPTCDFRWVELGLGKTAVRSFSFRTWVTGEWRRVAATSNLENYDLQVIGLCLRWRPWPALRWQGEITAENKDYLTPSKSSQKWALHNELTYRFLSHNWKGVLTENTREYPGNPWINYSYRSFRLEWDWKIAGNANLLTKCGLNYRRSGNGKEGGKLYITGIIDYPSSVEQTISWMYYTTKTIASYVPMTEEAEDEIFPFTNFRAGIRWKGIYPPFSFRTEFFGVQKEKIFNYGGMLKMQVDMGNVRWVLGLAPQGGFYQSEEKGYWLEVKYFFN
ncbi:MAG TPA: hypothetical protein DEB05_11915 [Firmicutes bacterium]|jgi:hypothetical protein|nr:hypothetical protein [Bacillota bacterium]